MTKTPTSRGSHLISRLRHRPTMLMLSLIVAALLAAGSIVGVLAQALGPAAPSPAQGHAAVVAHGVAQIPTRNGRWRVFTRTAAAGSAAVSLDAPTFILTTGNPLLVTDTQTGYSQRLAGDESFFGHAGQKLTIAPFGAAQQYYLIELGGDDVQPSSPAYYVSGSFGTDGAWHDLSLIRDILNDQEAGSIPQGAASTLVLVLSGSLDVTASGGKANALKSGQAGLYDGDLTVMGTAAGTSYIAAYIGPVIANAATPVASPVTAGTAGSGATPAPSSAATPASASTPTPTAAPTKVPPTAKPSPSPTTAPTATVVAKASAVSSPVATPATPAAKNPKGDDDKDGLTNAQEAQLGTDPENADTDDDGIDDGDEVNTYGTDPLNLDTDGDLLYDGGELVYGTGILDPDTDGDGLLDGQEVYIYGTDPLAADTDGDGVDDGQEIADGTNPLVAPPAPTATSAPSGSEPGGRQVDADGDGLTNAQEERIGTDPNNPDTDGDGMPDDQELREGTNPLVGDTDGDGVNDSNEVAAGTDPLNPKSYP